MALSELELKRIEKAVNTFMSKCHLCPERRIPLELGYSIKGHSVELFKIHRDRRAKKITSHFPFAKMTFVRTTQTWKLLCMRADLKWHAYPPAPCLDSIEDALRLVEIDECSCFFG